MSGYGLRPRRRTVLVALLVAAAMVYTLLAWRPPPSDDFLRLQRFMNPPGSRDAVRAVKSSFDWSAVKHEFPPADGAAPSADAAGKSAQGSKRHRIQHHFGRETARAALERASRRDAVRAEFVRCWRAYREHAWMKDALLPIAGGYKDQFSGWAATLVDSLDTLWIMGLRAEFDEAVEAVAGIDFGTSAGDRVNTFETNIRYLGGLMGAYDLSGREALLTKAVELGDFLYGAFNTENRMPVDFIDLPRAKTGERLFVEDSVVSASPGTLALEMTRLSQLTGHAKYKDAAMRVMRVFHAGQNRTRIPGLWPIMVSMKTQDVTGGDAFTLGGSADSLYEYLVKMAVLADGRDAMFNELSTRFMRAAEDHLFFRPMLPDGADVLISGNANYDGAAGRAVLDPETEHLACFVGGVFALAGRLYDTPADVATGARLTRGCVHAYRSMASGMGPERWNLAPCRGDHSVRAADCPWDEAHWEAEKAKRPEWRPNLPKGYTTAKDPRYILRPEAIESVFVLWRVTGDEWYRDAAWDMFRAVSKGTRTPIANAANLDVTLGGVPVQEDYMELLACRDAQVLLPHLLVPRPGEPGRLCPQHRGPSFPAQLGLVRAGPTAGRDFRVNSFLFR
ncbi:hypothetical protein RB598_004801 [Gaeumannomyces tritici]